MLNRREFVKSIGAMAASATALGAFATAQAQARGGAHVVVVGGGYGGATAAKYLRMWSNGAVRVTLVERERSFVSCPISNLVVAGVRQLDDITLSYDNLRSKWGVEIVTGEVVAIDVARRQMQLADGTTLNYDRAVLSPGIDFLPELIEGLAGNEELLPHAWKAGPQTALLRRQLEAMEPGGVFAIHIPGVPYRCPPGPYERACVAAHYLKTHKPGSKLILLDTNPDIQSKKGLFMTAFNELYSDVIEYRPSSTLRRVDAQARRLELEFDTLEADVVNVIPPMRAGRIVDQLGVPLVNDRWVDVEWLSLEVKGAPNVHVLGDALFPAPAMPKSGHMANQHAKVAAAAILNLLAGREPNPTPVVMNTCYSFVDDGSAMHVASVHQYDVEKQTFLAVEGSGGVSTAASHLEGQYALVWAKNVWADMLA